MLDYKRNTTKTKWALKVPFLLFALLTLLASCGKKTSCDCWGDMADQYEEARKNNYKNFDGTKVWTKECKDIIRSKENREEVKKMMEYIRTGKGSLCDGGKRFLKESNKYQLIDINEQFREQERFKGHEQALSKSSGATNLSEAEIEEAEKNIMIIFDSLMTVASEENAMYYEPGSTWYKEEPNSEQYAQDDNLMGSWYNMPDHDIDPMKYYFTRIGDLIVLQETYLGTTDYVVGTGSGSINGKTITIDYKGMFGTGKLTLKKVGFDLEGTFKDDNAGKTRKIEFGAGG